MYIYARSIEEMVEIVARLREQMVTFEVTKEAGKWVIAIN